MLDRAHSGVVVRPEFENRDIAPGSADVAAARLPAWRRLVRETWMAQAAILVALGLAWQLYATFLDNPLMLPSFTDTLSSLWDAAAHGPLFGRVATSLEVLLAGYAGGVLLAAVMTTLAVSSRFGTILLSTLTSMFNPLPAIALLPLALLWFGLGAGSIVFVLIHSVLWAVALNTHAGFLAVSDTQRMAGQNYGLRGIPFVVRILIPAAFPSILAGLKIGWAFAWRTEIAAELVFGATSGSGGLGWFIFEARNQLDTAGVFAGLVTVVLIGLAVENLVFRTVERRTVLRWGMQR